MIGYLGSPKIKEICLQSISSHSRLLRHLEFLFGVFVCFQIDYGLMKTLAYFQTFRFLLCVLLPIPDP